MQIKKMASMSSRTGRDLQRYNVHGCRQVVGCIPYRYKKAYQSPSVHGSPVDDLEFLLVSSQKSSRLMFPKGGWEQDETLEEAASRETFEEAGVLGEAENCLGTWSFKSKSVDAFHEGFMLPLFVTEELEHWPEREVRLRLWVSYEEAMEQCFHPWMKEALDAFVSRLTLQQRDVRESIYEEEETLMTEEPRTDIVSRSLQNKEEKSLGTVYCIEMTTTKDQTIGSLDQSVQLKVDEQPWNGLLIEIFVAQHLQKQRLGLGSIEEADCWVCS